MVKNFVTDVFYRFYWKRNCQLANMRYYFHVSKIQQNPFAKFIVTPDLMTVDTHADVVAMLKMIQIIWM
jgi:hypothetical protein